MPLIEAEFKKILGDTKFFRMQYHTNLHKYSLELLFDGHEIPNKYIIIENKIMYYYPKIYKMLGQRGDLQLIRKILHINHNIFGWDNAEYIMQGAAKVGHVYILRWMVQSGYRRFSSATRYAAEGNQLKTLKWLIDNNFGIDGLAVSYAGKEGHMNIIKFLIENDENCTLRSYAAAEKGRLDIVKYFYSLDPDSLRNVGDAAINSGYLDILKFAYENGYEYESHTICPHPHILTWLIDNGYVKSNINTSELVAYSGNLESLQLLYHNNFIVRNEIVFIAALSSGNILMIEWLHNINCPFNENIPDLARSLAILKLLVEWGYQVDKVNLSMVASNGDLECLQYLYAHGCKLSSEIISSAASNGHLHVIVWCREQGCPWDADACRITVRNHNLDVLRWLRGFDRNTCGLESKETEICPWNEDVCLEAIKLGHVAILKFALENGCQASYKTYRANAKSKNRVIDNYVYKYRR
uniref:Ankyrin repeat protein n=1 Tax=viral metagenome TaxID=1070528 RepID=A0A6C0C7H1_9ZZZZ